ncbi:MAG: chloride channel protein [Candidatus Jordarchaeales archaeon]
METDAEQSGGESDGMSKGSLRITLTSKIKSDVREFYSRIRFLRSGTRSNVSRLRLKIFLLSVIIGVLGGLGAIALRHAIDYLTEIFMLLPQTFGRHWIVALPAIGGFTAWLITHKFTPESGGRDGVAETMKAVSIGSGDINSRAPLATTLATSLTIGSGGSAGTEGPIIYISAGFASTVARLFKLDVEHKKLLVVCGAAAGLSAMFNAPIGGALFGLEVVHQGFEFPAVIPVLLSSTVATALSIAVMGDSPLFKPPPLTYYHHEVFFCFILGSIVGLLSVLWVKGFFKIEDILNHVNLSGYVKPMLGGALVGIIIYFLPHVGGEGVWVIKSALSGRIAVEMLLILGALKILTCGLTLGSGGSGGVFIPSMFIGAMFGGAFGLIINTLAPSLVSESTLYAVVGMAAMLAAACRAPLTGVIMPVEMMKDYMMALPLIAGCVTSYFVSRFVMKESIYTMGLFRNGIDVSLELRKDLLDYIKAGEIMSTNVTTLNPNIRTFQVLEIIEQTGHTGYLVVSSEGKLVGIVTFKDVIKAMKEGKKDCKIEDVMSRKLVVAYPDEPLRQVLDRMTEHGISRVPVVDRNNTAKILGIITKSDILKAHELSFICRLGRKDNGELRKLLEKIEEERVHEL